MLFFVYSDDATMRDWEDQPEGAQICVGELVKLLESPWAKEESQL